jgi:hypothetical protein
MNRLSKPLLRVAVATFWLTIHLLAGDLLAAETDDANPLRFYERERNSYLQANLQADFAVFTQKHSWFGNREMKTQGWSTDLLYLSFRQPGKGRRGCTA